MAAEMVKNLPAMRETQVRSLGKRRSPGEENGNRLQYSFLENSKSQRCEVSMFKNQEGRREITL